MRIEIREVVLYGESDNPYTKKDAIEYKSGNNFGLIVYDTEQERKNIIKNLINRYKDQDKGEGDKDAN